jgi:hypothetical protein
MKMSLEYILERKMRKERDLSRWREMEAQWMAMWRLDPGFGRSLEKAVEDGQEQIASPVPFNTINKAQQLFASTPRTDVIPEDALDATVAAYAQNCERFLNAMWRRLPHLSGHDPANDAIFNVLARGRAAIEVKWIKPTLPKMRQKYGFPLLIRSLNPRDVAVHYGPHYTEFAYHLYRTPIIDVLQRYPELRDTTRLDSRLGIMIQDLSKYTDGSGEAQEIDFLDFWYVSHEDGSVWNALVAEDEFVPRRWKGKMVSGPVDSEYPDIPLVLAMGDSAPGLGDEYAGLSLLHPINGTWQYQCRILSQKATRVMHEFFPTKTVMNEFGEDVDNLDLVPGEINPIPPGTTFGDTGFAPNSPLAQELFSQVDGFIQQSAFPEVLYGKAPGELQAGYGVSLLADSAKGRVRNFKISLELMFSKVNALTLALIEKYGGKEGVRIYDINRKNNEKEMLMIHGDMINGNYENVTHLDLHVASEQQATQTLGIRLADGKYISTQTLHEKYLETEVPDDEMLRITVEELMQADEMRSFRLRRAAQKMFKEVLPDGRPEWAHVLAGTPFLPEPPPDLEWDAYGFLVARGTATPPQPPPGQGGPPPGPPGAPMGPPPPIQPPATMTGPMGGGIPPELQGQLQGEDIGLPTDANPLLFGEMMGAPLPPGDELSALGGL